MNPNINKKVFIIAGAVIIILIIFILILIGILDGRVERKSIEYNANVQNKIESNDINIIENETENVIDNNTPTPDEIITGEITYVQTSDGGNLPVPPTFTYIGGDINNGAVIEDENGNQFVWVPVEDSRSYARQIFVNNGEGITVEDMESINLKDINSYNSEYDDSVKNYKGFYVARFEAGKDSETEKAVSKAGVLPWTNIVWQKAKDASVEMYPENDFFQSDLINSYAWDTTCNWVRDTSSVNIDDSTSYGNYQDSIDGLNRTVETGSNDRWSVNNIYDMAGNVWEYTTEEYGEHEKLHIGRGGGYWNYGNLYPISTRGPSEDASDMNIGFRVVIYLK